MPDNAPNSLRLHPLLERATPGSDAYTVGLRRLLILLKQRRPQSGRWQDVVQHARLLREWEALEREHLGRIRPLQRHRHLLVLTPQLRIGDLDASCYPVGIMLMFLLTGLFLHLGLGEAAIPLGCLGGMALMFLQDRAIERSQRKALESFGLRGAAPAQPHREERT